MRKCFEIQTFLAPSVRPSDALADCRTSPGVLLNATELCTQMFELTPCEKVIVKDAFEPPKVPLRVAGTSTTASGVGWSDSRISSAFGCSPVSSIVCIAPRSSEAFTRKSGVTSRPGRSTRTSRSKV